MITYKELSRFPFHHREAILAQAFADYIDTQLELPIEIESENDDDR